MKLKTKDALKNLQNREHTVDEYNNGGFFVMGLDGWHRFDRREDADLVAAALDACLQLRRLTRKAKTLESELQSFLN